MVVLVGDEAQELTPLVASRWTLDREAERREGAVDGVHTGERGGIRRGAGKHVVLIGHCAFESRWLID